MENVMRRCFPAILLFSIAATYGGHPDHRLGLRWAEKVSDTQIKLLFGASFVEKIGKNAQTYRVVSPTDPDFQKGVRGSSVTVRKEEDGPFPAGWQGAGRPARRTPCHSLLQAQQPVAHQ